MKILIDTSVWFLSLRKKTLTEGEKKIASELRELIREFRVVMIGPVRQELLSGISDFDKYKILRDKLRYFEDIILTAGDYEKAAELYNVCRKKGMQGSFIDFLICSVAVNRNISIFTTDKDFEMFKSEIDIRLHKIRDELIN